MDMMAKEFEGLLVRMQARRLWKAYRVRGMEPPGAVAALVGRDTHTQLVADHAAWRKWCLQHDLAPLLSLARKDTVLLEGDDDFEAIWRGEVPPRAPVVVATP